jgi:hypothetical protein
MWEEKSVAKSLTLLSTQILANDIVRLLLLFEKSGESGKRTARTEARGNGLCKHREWEPYRELLTSAATNISSAPVFAKTASPCPGSARPSDRTLLNAYAFSLRLLFGKSCWQSLIRALVPERRRPSSDEAMCEWSSSRDSYLR